MCYKHYTQEWKNEALLLCQLIYLKYNIFYDNLYSIAYIAMWHALCYFLRKSSKMILYAEQWRFITSDKVFIRCCFSSEPVHIGFFLLHFKHSFKSEFHRTVLFSDIINLDYFLTQMIFLFNFKHLITWSTHVINIMLSVHVYMCVCIYMYACMYVCTYGHKASCTSK